MGTSSAAHATCTDEVGENACGEVGPLARRLFTNVGWTLGSDLAARGASVWLALFCARVLSVGDFGLLAFAQAAGQYVWLSGDAVANSGYATRQIARGGGAPRRLAWDFYGARLAAACVVTVVFDAVVLALPMPTMQRGVLLAASLFFVSYALYPDWAARGLQDFRALAAGNAACAAALVGSTLVLLRVHPSPVLATALWAGSFAAGTLVLAPALARSFRLLPPHFQPRGWLRHARSSLAFSIGAALAVSLGQTPTLLLGVLCPGREVGLFAAGFRLVNVGLGALGILWVPVFPTLSVLAPSSPPFREVFRAFFTLMLALSLPAALALAMFASEALGTIFGPSYVAGAGTLRLLAWTLPLFATATVFEITLVASGGEMTRVRVYGLALATLVIVVLATVPRHGALGTAAALMVSLLVGIAGFVAALRNTIRPAWVAGPLVRILVANLAVGGFWAVGRSAGGLAPSMLLMLGFAIYAALAVALRLLPRDLWSVLRSSGSSTRKPTSRGAEEPGRW